MSTGPLTDPAFWRGWADMAERLVPAAVLLAAVLGLMLCGTRRVRVLGVSLFAGYLAHGLAFVHHTSTHDYYHVLLVPPVLIGVGAAAEAARAAADRRGMSPATATVVVGSVVAASFVLGPRPYPYVESRLPDRLAALVGQAEQAGAAVGNDGHVLFVSRAYGSVQQYYGYMAGPPWPLSADLEAESTFGKAPTDAEERLQALEHPVEAERWVVEDGPIEWVLVTEPAVLDEQPDLAALIREQFTPAATGEGWTAYRRR